MVSFVFVFVLCDVCVRHRHLTEIQYEVCLHFYQTSPLLFWKPHLPNQGEYQNTFLRHNLRDDWYGYKGGVQKNNKGGNQGNQS